MDKFIDFVLGDGPNNRFALICSSCFSHNGLVRPEEVATIRFRCQVCNWVNSAQKLPKDWTPTIHGRTQTAIIQSTPTHAPPPSSLPLPSPADDPPEPSAQTAAPEPTSSDEAAMSQVSATEEKEGQQRAQEGDGEDEDGDGDGDVEAEGKSTESKHEGGALRSRRGKGKKSPPLSLQSQEAQVDSA